VVVEEGKKQVLICRHFLKGNALSHTYIIQYRRMLSLANIGWHKLKKLVFLLFCLGLKRAIVFLSLKHFKFEKIKEHNVRLNGADRKS